MSVEDAQKLAIEIMNLLRHYGDPEIATGLAEAVGAWTVKVAPDDPEKRGEFIAKMAGHAVLLADGLALDLRAEREGRKVTAEEHDEMMRQLAASFPSRPVRAGRSPWSL